MWIVTITKQEQEYHSVDGGRELLIEPSKLCFRSKWILSITTVFRVPQQNKHKERNVEGQQ
jgi:hypothetical protein